MRRWPHGQHNTADSESAYHRETKQMTNELTVNINSVTFQGMVDALMLGVSIDVPTIFLGTYGIAKSAGIKQVADRMGRCVVDFRASEVLPEDVGGIGIPHQNEAGTHVVTRAVPDIVQACYNAQAATGKDVVLFLDEITSAVPSVQAALFQVLLDRRAGMYELPANTYVVAAGNLATDRSVVEELARPLLNRAMVYNYTGPTFDEFDSYMAASNFSPIIRTFLKVNPNYVCGKIDPDNEQSPTPRSWEVASNLLKSDLSHRVGRLTALGATVGGEAAQNLETYLTMSDKLIPFSTIVGDPENAPCPTGKDFASDYMQVVALAGGVNRNATEKPDDVTKTTGAAWTYARRMPVELGVVFLASLKGPAMNAIITGHIDEITSAHDGAYADVMRDIV